MRQVQWDGSSYIIDGKPAYLFSGEFHYFRVPKQDWRRRLELFKEAGGNCVATYIPWILHEPTEGDIRFGDTDQRDLEGFLKLCGEVGLLVVCRPGPYQYSELKYNGLPGWLCENYPQILAQDVHGHTIQYFSVSYMHPLFLQKTKKYFDAVLPILTKYTVENGGPVAFVQFDNELTGMHLWYGGMDYNREAMGIGSETGRYPQFLKRRYGSVNSLNRSYGTSFESFAAVRPADPAKASGTEGARAVKDYQDFYLSTIADYAVTLSGWIRDAGIRCSLVHNSGNPGMNLLFRETAEKLKGNNFVLGSDHYYNLDMDWAQNNPTPQYASNVWLSFEELRNMGFPASAFELPSGSCSEWPPITPDDLRCCYYTNLALGMKGVNYYVFTGGPNPEGLGENGDSYDYNAPVGATGDIRPAYYMMKEFGQFLRRNAWMSRAERVADVSIGYVPEYGRSDAYSRITGGVYSANSAWTFLRKGLAITSFCASLSPALVDIESADLKSLTTRPMLIASASTMSEKAQRALVDFVQAGGRLLISPVIPWLDENFNPCTVLKDFLGCGAMKVLPQNAPSARVGDVNNILPIGDLWQCERPQGAQVVGVEQLSGREFAWKKTYGHGLVLWMGLSWKHRKAEHTRMMKTLAGELSVGRCAVECDNQNVWTSLWSDGSRSMLFVMNLLSSPMEVGVAARRTDGSYDDLGKLQLKPMEVKVIEL